MAPRGAYGAVPLGGAAVVDVRDGRLVDRAPATRVDPSICGEDPYPTKSSRTLALRVVWDHGSFVETLERARDIAGYARVRDEQRRLRPSARRLGIGVASYVELTGVGSAIPASPGAAINTGTEGATIRVDPGGTVTAIFGVASHARATRLAAQIVAEELGASFDDVARHRGRHRGLAHGNGTYASRTAVIAGGAAILAARAVKEKAVRIASHQLEAGVDDVVLEDGAPACAPPTAASAARHRRRRYAGSRKLPRAWSPGLRRRASTIRTSHRFERGARGRGGGRRGTWRWRSPLRPRGGLWPMITR